ncbi:MobA/MobL family protein [Pseudomonas lundensis]|uniref:MobA/MobL family protein n=1 Tax=Pseudomonas lundensis TaxID=86185 RepID=UPI00201DBABF|nr:MobA/MobL family protein [Pseudomonas lundensis]
MEPGRGRRGSQECPRGPRGAGGLRAELSPAQRRELTQGIAQALADRYGTAGTLAVHTPDREGDQRNHHAHILMTTRRLEPSARWARRPASWTT